MANNGVKFSPAADMNITIGGGGAGTFSTVVNTGALVAGVEKAVAHGLVGYTNFSFSAFDPVANNTVEVNKLCVDPANPASKFLIISGTSVAGGLDVTVHAF
jgi:hypothetical protein